MKFLTCKNSECQSDFARIIAALSKKFLTLDRAYLDGKDAAMHLSTTCSGTSKDHFLNYLPAVHG